MTFTSPRLASQRFIRPYPLLGRSYTPTVNTATSLPTTTTLTAGAANTKGSWATLVASTSVPTTAVLLSTLGTTGLSGSEKFVMLDLALGPSGGPTILVNNLQVGLRSSTNRYTTNPIPLRLPAGVELIARIQSPVAATTVLVNIQLVGDRGGAPAYRGVTTYGANTATTHGTALTTPGAINTKGAWTELTASTTEYIRALSWGISAEYQPGFSALSYLFDVGVGAGGSESVVIGNIAVRTAVSESIFEWLPGGFMAPVDLYIPKGSRLAARFQVAAALNQDLELVLYGWY